MIELSPARALQLSSPIKSILCGDSCYAVTAEGEVYSIGDGVQLAYRMGGQPLAASVHLGRLTLVTSTGQSSSLVQLEDHRVRSAATLPRLEGVALSESLSVLWYSTHLIKSRVHFFYDDNTVALELPRVLAAAAGASSAYLLTIQGKLHRLDFPGAVEAWSADVGRSCDRVVAGDGWVAVRCDERLIILESGSGARLAEIPAGRLRRMLPLRRTLALWEVEDPEVVLFDVDAGQRRSLVLEPLYGLIASRGHLLALLKWKLAELSPMGEVVDILFLPLPLVENLERAPSGNYLFSLREWLIEAAPERPSLSVRVLKIESAGEQQLVELEVKAQRPSSLAPLTASSLKIYAGEQTQARLTLSEGGGARLTLALKPGRTRLTLGVESEVQAGLGRAVKRLEVEKELEIPSVVEKAATQPGDMLGGRIRLQERLGEGGFGVVFKGRDTVTDRLVAVKIPHAYFAEGEVQGVIVTEALRMAEVSRMLNRDEKVVVEVYEAGVYELENLGRRSKGKALAIVMEFCSGGSLRHLMDSGWLKAPLSMAAKISDKVARLNEAGIVHGDLKPENILLSDGNEPLLSDFYTATFLSSVESVRKYRSVAFTEGYAPPEIMEKGIVSAKTDVYSLAALMVEMLTGRLPAPGSLPSALIEKGFDQRLVDLIKRALSINPEERPTAGEFRDSLLQVVKQI